ncbi:UNVERIFIED_CONTAM: hypothetical protein PYX00_001267 [Menopon gallinae]|uniref:JNK-interacting protein 1 n=1 Tax=Menopon gallinae TaxID=328185 RepID=A0AAW2IBV2_9NEOP
MADTEFEQLTNYHQIPQHIKARSHTYTLVHIDEDSPTSTEGEEVVKNVEKEEKPSTSRETNRSTHVEDNTVQNGDCDIIGLNWTEAQRFEDEGLGSLTGERRRRRLPEIPANKKPMVVKQLSLAEELGTVLERTMPSPTFSIGGQVRACNLFRYHNYLREEDSSPDSDRFHSTDVDSGNSTAHSPDGIKSVSPQPNNSMSPGSPTSSTERTPFTDLELLDPTHRGLHRFVTRHRDEVDIEIGDPIYVQKEADDLWCEGINLRTGRQGIFPSAYVVDVDYSDFDPTTPKVKRERFILGYLGSVETLCHKGNTVLCQAVKKIKSKDYTPHSCILEVSDTGLRMVDRKKPQRKEVPCHDYFYSLKNVSFCAFHPRDQRYLGFITKHPHCDRFACHVFIGNESTRPVAEAVGRAFQRFYQKFIETAFPVEDIYLE